MEQERIQLKIMGISAGALTSGAYLLVLGQTDGPVRIPVVISEADARSITSRVDNIQLPRPVMHDVVNSLIGSFGIELTEVFIHKFEDGIFHSELTFSNDEQTIRLASRTSDALALALRSGAPVFTTPAIMRECGFVMDERPSHADDAAEPAEPTVEELEARRELAVACEDYEEASRLTEIINQKKSI